MHGRGGIQSGVPAEEWENLRGEKLGELLKSIGPNSDNLLAHLPATSPPQLAVAYLHRDGAVIIDEAVSVEVCDATIAEMKPYIEATGTGDAFTGKNTKRAGALVARSPTSWEMAAHPMLMGVCDGVLGHQLLAKNAAGRKNESASEFSASLTAGYRTHPWQLHLTQIIQIGTAEPAQPM
jgi:hypothetical protein